MCSNGNPQNKGEIPEKYRKYLKSEEEMENTVKREKEKVFSLMDFVCGMLETAAGSVAVRRFKAAVHLFFNRDEGCASSFGVLGIWWAIVAVLFYLILPVDAVPDFIPIVGFADDIAFMLFVFEAFGVGKALDCYADCVGIS